MRGSTPAPHPTTTMINRLWPDRRPLVSYAIPTAGATGWASARGVEAAFQVHNRLRRAALTRLLEIDPQQFSEHFARDPFTVQPHAHRPPAALGRVAREARRPHPGRQRRAQPRRRARGARQRRGPEGRPHARRDRPRHRDQRLLDGAQAHRAGPGVQGAARRDARRGGPARVRPRGRHAPARGLRLPVGAELGHAVAHRPRAQLPAAGPRLEGDARGPLHRPEGRAGDARALLRRRAPQPRLEARGGDRPTGSTPATASTCRCTRRTSCATATPSRSRSRSPGSRRRSSATRACTR